MSRELKFRAWDKKNKKIVKVLKICWGSSGKILELLVEDFDTNHAYRLEPKDAILEQYTGLKDKNGKEICEGDIITRDSLNLEHGALFVVRRGDYNSIDICGHEYCPFVQGCYLEEIDEVDEVDEEGYMEVIGNIHENPDLLSAEVVKDA